MFFFFQAEDGIRDLTVTGVQTCALPIWPLALKVTLPEKPPLGATVIAAVPLEPAATETPAGVGDSPERSGEGRGGEEGRFRGAPDYLKKKKKNREGVA